MHWWHAVKVNNSGWTLCVMQRCVCEPITVTTSHCSEELHTDWMLVEALSVLLLLL